MITYKNISYSAKTFYGVKFEPGEVKSVPGFINSSSMIRVDAPKSNSTSNKINFLDVPTQPSNRGRKKKSNEPEKDSVAETQEIKIISEEETSDGNPS